jgi:hypothetical protein
VSGWKDSDTFDKAVIIVAVVIGIYVVGTLAGTFVLEVMGKETGEVWGRSFDLVGVLAGGLVGFIAGQAAEQRKIQVNGKYNGNGGDAGLGIIDDPEA